MNANAEPELRAVLTELLQDPEAGWSVGSFGAIAEFHQDPGEPLEIDAPEALTRATARGALRIDRLDGVRPIAFETLSPRPHRWTHGIALCLPTADAQRAERRSTLTEIGADADAIRPQDRAGVLFDMGLDQPQIGFCIRTSDAALLQTLRDCAGRSLFEPDNPAMGAILAANPHRVSLSNIGRAEVFQPIGGPATGGVSPAGPHTHVLPKLLRSGRTHSANTPIPEAWTPCAMAHPENPVIGPLGEERRFGGSAFDAFQQILQRWGPAPYITVKNDVWRRLEAGDGADAYAEPSSRLERTALRMALRQRHRQAELSEDGAMLSRLNAWRAAFDAQTISADDEVHA